MSQPTLPFAGRMICPSSSIKRRPASSCSSVSALVTPIVTSARGSSTVVGASPRCVCRNCPSIFSIKMAFVVVLPQSVATMTLIFSGSVLLMEHPRPNSLQVFRLRAIGGNGVVWGRACLRQDLQRAGRRNVRAPFPCRLPRLPGGGLQKPQELRAVEQPRAGTAHEQSSVRDELHRQPVEVEVRSGPLFQL